MANSTQDCVDCDASLSPQYPSPLSEIDSQLALTTPSSFSLENTATTCDTAINDAVRIQESSLQSNTSGGSDEAISQGAVQYSPDDCQIALNLQQLRYAHESLQHSVPLYTAVHGDLPHIRYSAGPFTVSQSSSTHAPVDGYHIQLAEPGEAFQHRATIVSQPHSYVGSSAQGSTVYPSLVPGYIGPYLLSEQFSQQRSMPTPISTPPQHEMTVLRPFPSMPLSFSAHPSQPIEQPNVGIVNTPMSTKPRPSRPRRHMCSICDKEFPRPSALRTHSLKHSGERPHPCPVEGCDRHREGNGFSVRSNMTRHVKTRHREWNGGINGRTTNSVMATQ
jgi:hypothetical protein